MAFAVKYRIDFTDVWKHLWRIDVLEDAFAGTLTELTATGNPLSIQYDTASDEYNEPVRPSKAVFSVMSLTDMQLVDFYSDQDFRLKVIVYSGSSIYWQGFVVTAEYSEPYDCPPYPVTITAIDGLNYLKNILYDDDGTYYNGRKTYSQIIIDILLKIQITGFREYVNTYEDNMESGTGDSPFTQTVVDVDIFRDMTCYEVLAELLKPFNAVVRQNNGNTVITSGNVYGSEILSSWANSTGIQAYDTFTSSGKDITSAIQSADWPGAAALSNVFTLNNGDVLEINITLTNNAVYFPWLYFHRSYSGGETTSHWVTESGLKTYTYTADQDYTDVYFYFSTPIPLEAVDFSAVCSVKLILATSSATSYAGGEIVIYRPEELALATVYGRIFTSATDKTATSFDPDQFISRTTVSQLRQLPGSALMIKGAVKNISLNQDYGIKESWIENWDLKGNTFTGSGLVWTLENWTKANSLSVQPVKVGGGNGNDGVYAMGINSYPTLDQYIYQTFGSYAFDTTDTFTFEFEWLLQNSSAADMTGKTIYVKIANGAGTRWLRETSTAECDWHTSDTLIAITADAPVGSTGWTKWSRTFAGIPTDGTYVVYLFGSGTASLTPGYKNIKFYTTSVEIMTKNVLVGYKPVKSDKFLTTHNKRFIPTAFYVKEYYESPVNIVRRTYEITNALIGRDLAYNYLLGDVSDANLDNVVEQFAGALSMPAEDYRVDTITLTGGEASAEAIITVDGLTRMAVWDSDRATTAAAFAADYDADYLNITVTSSGDDIIFTSDVLGLDFSGASTIYGDVGSLEGTVEYTTPARPITALTYTTVWSTRSPGGESDPLLQISGGELGNQYSRPKQLIQMNIADMYADSPVLDIVKNIQDSVNLISGNNRIFVVNQAEFDVKNRVWNIDLIEII